RQSLVIAQTATEVASPSQRTVPAILPGSAPLNAAARTTARPDVRNCILSRHPRSFPLLHRDDPIARPRRKRLALTARPLHFDALVAGVVAQPEMQPRVVLREKARSALDLARQLAVAHEHIGARPDRVAIAFLPAAFDQQPVLLAAEVFQQA